MSEQIEQVPALRISVTHALNQEQSVGFETFLPWDVPVKDLHSLLDKLSAAGVRAKAQADLPTARRQLRNIEAAYTRAIEDMERLDKDVVPAENRRKAPSTAQTKDRETALVSISRWKADALKVREQIAELEQTINGSG